MNLMFKHKKSGYVVDTNFFNDNEYLSLVTNELISDMAINTNRDLEFKPQYLHYTLLDIFNSNDFTIIDNDITDREWRYIYCALLNYGGRDEIFNDLIAKIEKKGYNDTFKTDFIKAVEKIQFKNHTLE